MPIWKPQATWAGKDVFIIGGGSSLSGFEWTRLWPECTIGINDAYQLGVKIAKVCYFGDYKWYRHHERRLWSYEGTVFTSAPQLWKKPPDSVWVLSRKAWGLFPDKLGWYENSGASAINLALILGAQRVYLLGYDGGFRGKDSHWHKDLVTAPQQTIYDRFRAAFRRLANDLPGAFPGREVINVSDCSSLDMFPMVDPKEFWAERTVGDGVVAV